MPLLQIELEELTIHDERDFSGHGSGNDLIETGLANGTGWGSGRGSGLASGSGRG